MGIFLFTIRGKRAARRWGGRAEKEVSMEKKMYGYVRVSTKEQCEDRQMLALGSFGVKSECIYMDKLSGKDFNRPSYRRLLRRVREGDVIVIKSIDRLGRNYDEIQRQWRIITRDKNVDIVVLDMPLLDTRRSGNDLTGKFVADLVLQILSYVAQTERENTRQRQLEGIEAARIRGVRFGRPQMNIPENFYRLLEDYRERRISSRQAARELGVAQDTFLRWAKKVS